MKGTSTVKRWLGGFAALTVIVCALVYFDSRVGRELRRLPDADRRALYQRTIETLRTSCLKAEGPMLSDYCCEQADFIERFPECGADCRTLAKRFTPRPTHGLR